MLTIQEVISFYNGKKVNRLNLREKDFSGITDVQITALTQLIQESRETIKEVSFWSTNLGKVDKPERMKPLFEAIAQCQHPIRLDLRSACLEESNGRAFIVITQALIENKSINRISLSNNFNLSIPSQEVVRSVCALISKNNVTTFSLVRNNLGEWPKTYIDQFLQALKSSHLKVLSFTDNKLDRWAPETLIGFANIIRDLDSLDKIYLTGGECAGYFWKLGSSDEDMEIVKSKANAWEHLIDCLIAKKRLIRLTGIDVNIGSLFPEKLIALVEKHISTLETLDLNGTALGNIAENKPELFTKLIHLVAQAKQIESLSIDYNELKTEHLQTFWDIVKENPNIKQFDFQHNTGRLPYETGQAIRKEMIARKNTQPQEQARPHAKTAFFKQKEAASGSDSDSAPQKSNSPTSSPDSSQK